MPWILLSYLGQLNHIIFNSPCTEKRLKNGSKYSTLCLFLKYQVFSQKHIAVSSWRIQSLRFKHLLQIRYLNKPFYHNQKLPFTGWVKFVLSYSSLIRKNNFQYSMKGPKAFREERGKNQALFHLVQVVLYQEDPPVYLELYWEIKTSLYSGSYMGMFP